MQVASEDKAPSHAGIEATWGALSGYTSIHAPEQVHVSDGQKNVLQIKLSNHILFLRTQHTALSLSITTKIWLGPKTFFRT